MTTSKRIAIDAMGGDGGVELTVPATIKALETNPDFSAYLVGDQHQIEPFMAGISTELSARLTLIPTEHSIGDEDKPANALRSARESSMYKAVELLESGDAQAMVSAGNTGALLMIGRHLLKTIPGIQKPALVTAIPGVSQATYLLDVGANPECNARQLLEFAVMGSVLAESLTGKEASVALLNIGAEHHKGTGEVREAGTLLEESGNLNYAGFVEPNDLFEAKADVVVCDGFVGNVTIKTSAGAANVIQNMLQDELFSQLQQTAPDVDPAELLAKLSERINPHRFNGASLLGLQGSIIKSHGNATGEGFRYAIQEAVSEVDNAVPQLIAEKVAAIMSVN